MTSLVVSGKKYEEAEQKIHEFEKEIAEMKKENSMLKEQLEELKKKNAELEEKVSGVVFAVDKKDVVKAKEEIVEKAKGAMGDYLKKLTE